MQLFLLSLLLDALVLPQQFLVIVVLVILGLRVHPRLLLLLFRLIVQRQYVGHKELCEQTRPLHDHYQSPLKQYSSSLIIPSFIHQPAPQPIYPSPTLALIMH